MIVMELFYTANGCKKEANKEMSLLEELLLEGFDIGAACGGKGRCGKCKVRVVSGEAPVTAEDREVFSDEELLEGWRLSCMLYPKGEVTVTFKTTDDAKFVAVSDYSKTQNELPEADKAVSEMDYEVAIDIGTTTLAFQLLEKKSGKIKNTATAINSQRVYGADVVSRIMASASGKQAELKESIRKDLRQGILALIGEYSIQIEQLTRIAIACNTTMGHLLMGYDCKSLGTYPFTPVNVDFITGSMEELLGMSGDAQVILLPGISAYIGGDIVAGMYACAFEQKEELSLLVDLGTNGEIALGNRLKILAASAAAGPAFEGGNIKWGMGSVEGAICSVELDGANVKLHTILDKIPAGICGTGVVEAVAELLKEELVDETGLLDEKYFDNGFPMGVTEDGQQIVLTQKDIRELQLAKAAIRAGIETLLFHYGVTKEQVSKVYLAGGFGYYLNVKKAIAIGLLPKEFELKTIAVGNVALEGAVRYLKDNGVRERLKKIVSVSQEVSLSLDKSFNEFYIENMMFTK